MKSSSSATSSPVAPPPPPPPPPPQLELDEEMRLLAKEAEVLAPKRMDFRDILTLFHDQSTMDPSARDRAWENLWSATLAEAQEEHRLQRKLGSKGAQDDASRGGKSSGPDPPKRPRQPSAADTEPNKLSRVNRVPNRPKTGGSKLMQKLGARGT